MMTFSGASLAINKERVVLATKDGAMAGSYEEFKELLKQCNASVAQLERVMRDENVPKEVA